jgi:hypothetical protein
MKLYLFYLFDEPNNLIADIYPAIDGLEIIRGCYFSHVLYGWTPNKDIRKQFKSLRDMSKFREVIHELSKEDFNKFSDEYSDTFLEERLITTKKIEDGKIEKRHLHILSTRKELDTMVYDENVILRKQLEDVISSNIYIREEYFKTQYQKVLSFFQLNNILSSTYPLDDSDCPPFNLFHNDNLAIYSHLYHNTYRKDIDNNESL